MREGNVGVIVKVGIYLRKSRSEDGTTADLAKHKEYLVEVCTRNGWLFDLYEEISSSQDINRPELQRLRRDIELGKIDAVMVHAVDRLSRKTRHFLEIIEDYFLDQGVTKLYVKDQVYNLTDSNTITMLQIQATLSQSEYSFIVKRLNDGRKSSAKKGIWSGKTVFGYRFNKESKQLELVEGEAPIVRKICDMVLEGYPFLTIADELNKLGYRTRKGNPFQMHNIKSIINSPFIRGHVEVNWVNKVTKEKELTVVRDSHEAIITEGEYAQIQKILESRAKHHSNIKVKPMHFLQGLLKCKVCGLTTVIQADSNPSGKSGNYYIRICKGCHANFGCNIKVVEGILEKVLEGYTDDIKNKIDELANANQGEITADLNKRKKELEVAIKKIESKEDVLLDMVSEKDIDRPTYNKRVERLKNEKAILIQDLESVPVIDVGVVREDAENQLGLIQEYKALSNEDKRRLLQLLCERIEYDNSVKKGDPILDIYPNE